MFAISEIYCSRERYHLESKAVQHDNMVQEFKQYPNSDESAGLSHELKSMQQQIETLEQNHKETMIEPKNKFTLASERYKKYCKQYPWRDVKRFQLYEVLLQQDKKKLFLCEKAKHMHHCQRAQQQCIIAKHQTEETLRQYFKANQDYKKAEQRCDIAIQDLNIAQRQLEMTYQKYFEIGNQIKEAQIPLKTKVHGYAQKTRQEAKEIEQLHQEVEQEIKKLEKKKQRLYDLARPLNIEPMVLQMYLASVQLIEEPHRYQEIQQWLENIRQQYEENQQLQEKVRQSKYISCICQRGG